jgi:hypothetical protein
VEQSAGFQFIAVPFASPAVVASGTRYAIVAYTGGTDHYGWRGTVGDPYAEGAAFSSSASPPSAWALRATTDLVFRTFVNQAPTGRSPAAAAVAPTFVRARST